MLMVLNVNSIRKIEVDHMKTLKVIIAVILVSILSGKVDRVVLK